MEERKTYTDEELSAVLEKRRVDTVSRNFYHVCSRSGDSWRNTGLRSLPKLRSFATLCTSDFSLHLWELS